MSTTRPKIRTVNLDAVVIVDETCAACNDDTDCPHGNPIGVYLASVKAATALLSGLAENEAPETWQEVLALWPAVDDLYRAVAKVKKRAVAAGMNMMQHHKTTGDLDG